MAKARSGRQDVYPNRALFNVTLSAANTLTFQQIRFGMGLFQGTAIIVNRIDWHLDMVTVHEIITNGDEVRMALTNRDDITALAMDNMNVLAMNEVTAIVVGTVVGIMHFRNPIVQDFSNLPGGGLIIPANPLFIGAVSLGITAAITVQAVMYYQTKVLADADYIELVQSLIPLNI